MEYTILNLSKLAGISTRTLRYYDEIKILVPARINSSGYRIYGEKEVNRLQQILFYKELGLGLEEIKTIITSPSFDSKQALKSHHKKLLQKRKQLDLIIQNVENSILASKGELEMSNEQKFEGLKKQLIDENEKKYGKEIRSKYGEDTINKSNKKFANMTEEEFNKFNALGEEINQKLLVAFKTGDTSSNEAKEVVKLHKEWLMYTWSKYSKEAHIGLAEMYVADERFTAYYDKEQSGLAQFLRDSILLELS